MKNTIIIRNLLLSGLLLLLISSSALAAALVRKGTGQSGFNLDPTVFQFYNDLGGTFNGSGNSYTTGFRSLNWDDVPDSAASNFPNDFFNTTVPRGVVFSNPCSGDRFHLSAASGSPQSSLYFGNVNPNYATDFRTYLGSRLFSSTTGACNAIDVFFYIPGTKIPATVSGFGAIFSDVDTNQSVVINFYGVDGKQIGASQTANALNNGLSFLGATFNAGERIARVRIYSGTATLGDVDVSRGGQYDVVVMDDFFYAEPRAIGQHSSDFDGDGTSDYAVFRPSAGAWYWMNSGSNTFSGAQFGANGDLPVDGDFDGDSRNDLAVFRPSNGGWYILRSSNGQLQSAAFGQAGDKPISADYDKDGKSDIAVWRPSTGTYFYLKSSNGQFTAAAFGAAGDIPIGSSAAQ